MATNKARFEIYISKDTKVDMELLYNGLYNIVSRDKYGELHVDISRSRYWESVIREHLNRNGDILRIFRMKASGELREVSEKDVMDSEG